MKKKTTKYIQELFCSHDDKCSEWFGYYNYDTLNNTHTKMLCNRAMFDGIAPEKGLIIELGYYDLNDGCYHHIDNSDSWNWQQGAMLQWLPGEGNETKVIYNTSRDNHITSCIYDIETHEKQTLDWSIYGITPDGTKSIALEMERSRWCRAYHYKSIDNEDWEGNIVDNDGIFEIDLHNNIRKRIISIHDIISLDSDKDFNTKKHWVEHIMISPSGKRFCFLHRFSDANNILNYQTRLCIADINGDNLQVVNGWRDFSWSHFGWKTDDEFTIYTVMKKSRGISNIYSNLVQDASAHSTSIKGMLKKLARKCVRLIPQGIRLKLKSSNNFYQYYTLIDGEWRLVANWDDSSLNIDGHPSFTKDGRYMITDSYPDHKQYQRLIVYDTQTRKSVIIGKFFASFMGNPASCDLHPKLSHDDSTIVVDSAFDNKHHMIQYKLNWERIKKKIS